MTSTAGNFEEQGAIRLTLEIWHPDCWTLEATEQTECGLVAHTVYNTQSDAVKGHFTVFADTANELDEFVEVVQENELTESVMVTNKRHDFTERKSKLGNTSRELFVQYDPQNSMSDALLSLGFIHDAPVRVNDGKEYWPVVVTADRKSVNRRLELLREEKGAEINVTRIMSDPEFGSDSDSKAEQLSQRQREMFLLACDMGYYSWPRETTTREMADQLDITKTTFLEHLRKAEAKLLNADSVR